MNIYYSELCLLGRDVLSNVDKLIANGADNIELMLDGPGWDRFEMRMDSLVPKLLQRRVSYSIHSPVWDTNLTSENYFVREGVKESLRQSIVLANKLHAAHVVIHPGICLSTCFNKETAKKRARESLLELLAFNRDYGMRLLIENVGDNQTSLFTQEEFARFLDDFPDQSGFLIDIGHAHKNGWDIPLLLSTIKKQLYAVHIHDNNGRYDQHYPIGNGTTDWETVFSAIDQADRNLNLVLEYDIGTPLQNLADGKKILERRFPTKPSV